MSRSVWASSTVSRSTEPIVPPASPIAVATRPSIPGRSAISTRIVSEYWAEVGRSTAAVRAAARYPAAKWAVAATPDVPARRLGSWVDAGPADRALPDRRQLARLPGVLRAARGDLDVRRAPDEHDLRLRLDAREAAHRLRPAADGRGLGQGHVRPQGDLRGLQGPAPLAARPAEAPVAAPGAAGRGVRLPQLLGRGLRGRRRDRRALGAGARAGHRRDGGERRPRRLPARRRRRDGQGPCGS